MKKKSIIILAIIIGVILVGIVLFSVTSGEDSKKILECSGEKNSENRVMLLTNSYSIDEENALKTSVKMEFEFGTKEEADKYEKALTIAFYKHKVIRENNKIIVSAESVDDENELSLNELKKQQEEKGLECNYK